MRLLNTIVGDLTDNLRRKEGRFLDLTSTKIEPITRMKNLLVARFPTDMIPLLKELSQSKERVS